MKQNNTTTKHLNQNRMKTQETLEEVAKRLIFETISGKYGLSSINEHDQVDGYFETYEEAELACLEKLIEIVEQIKS